MQFMSKASHSPKIASFVAKFIPSEILFCHFEMIFFAAILEKLGKRKEFKKQVFNPKLV